MYHIVINPASRSGKGKKYWEKARPYFEESGMEYKVYFSDEKTRIGDITASICRENDRPDIVIMGGDGTLNAALNGIPDLSSVRLGFIPIGSGNDYAKAAGISKNLKTAVHSITSGTRVHTLDIGRLTWRSADNNENADSPVHSSYFMISTGLGFDAAICYNVDHSRMKKILNRLRLGKLTYLIESVKTILAIKKTSLKVELNDYDKVFEYNDCLITVCMNHRFEGGGFMFAPDADPADGALDLVISTGMSKIHTFLMFPLAYKGRHKGRRGVVMLQVQKAAIRSDLPLYIHTDGEVPDTAREIQIEILPGSITMLN